jgi:pimeloyl-ACP methyl ester carboxylesterase
MLKIEAGNLVPPGKLVEVNNHKLHVYSEGPKDSKYTLVFMAGSGTPAPVYDFKALYNLMSDKYRIVVIEKIGYGYSDISNDSRDIDTMLDETRQAIKLAGEAGPYVLFPHSLSGIEALYWVEKYPEEIAGIVGLDMALPDDYTTPFSKEIFPTYQVMKWLGFERIPGVVPPFFNEPNLTQEETQQVKYLINKNIVNVSISNEGASAYTNAKKVAMQSIPNKPMLLFLSNGKQTGGDIWIKTKEKFAKQTGAELVQLKCDHYVHLFEYKYIAEKSKEYLKLLP